MMVGSEPTNSVANLGNLLFTSTVIMAAALFAVCLWSGLPSGNGLMSTTTIAGISNTSTTTGVQPSTTTGVTMLIVSDGTRARPHCSWASSCKWDNPTKSACAEALCQAAGYPLGGTYVSATNNMCKSGSAHTSGRHYHYMVDKAAYTTKWLSLDSQITAACNSSITSIEVDTPRDNSDFALGIPIIIVVGSVLMLAVTIALIWWIRVWRKFSSM